MEVIELLRNNIKCHRIGAGKNVNQFSSAAWSINGNVLLGDGIWEQRGFSSTFPMPQ